MEKARVFNIKKVQMNLLFLSLQSSGKTIQLIYKTLYRGVKAFV